MSYFSCITFLFFSSFLLPANNGETSPSELMVKDGINAMYNYEFEDAITILDSAWGIDKQIQLGVFGKTVATKLLPTKYHDVVKGLGGYGELVENISEFPEAIERALSSGLPSLINVKIKGVVSPRGQSAINRWKSNEISPI